MPFWGLPINTNAIFYIFIVASSVGVQSIWQEEGFRALGQRKDRMIQVYLICWWGEQVSDVPCKWTLTYLLKAAEMAAVSRQS